MSFNYIDRCAILAWDPKYAESSFVVCGSIEHQNYDNKNPALELFFTNDVSKPIGKEHVSSRYLGVVFNAVLIIYRCRLVVLISCYGPALKPVI